MLIYKYQILYLDHIIIVVWRHLVNDIDLYAARNRQKIHKTPYFGVQGHSEEKGHWIRRQSRASVPLPISD